MVSAKSVARYVSTVRHLHGRQIAGQLRNRLRPLFEDVNSWLLSKTPPSFPGYRWNLKGHLLAPGCKNNCEEDILKGYFSFLNNRQHLGWLPSWDCDHLPKLWQYNLHYFEFLWILKYEQAKQLVLDWIFNHQLAPGQVGWQPYPTSLRLINWCSVFFGKYRQEIQADEDFLNKLWASVYIQAEWLWKHLETHLLGNHLFENVAALAFAGSCFPGPAAANWLRVGMSILTREIHAQILEDGMHFELSPMYHCRITYLLAMLYSTGNERIVDLVSKPLKKTIEALGCTTCPDGQIALLNDSAFAIYNGPRQLESYVKELFGGDNRNIQGAAGPFSLPEAGYYGYKDGAGTYVICDAGPIGPAYIPGHAHADMFSFELSLNGFRVIVDSGVCDYEPGSMRQYCRSTRAHNTVEIDGQDQCEMWGVFRVGRRGHPKDVNWKAFNDGFHLSGWHDGYKRLKGKPIHRRDFYWFNSGRLTIKDRITAFCPQNMVSRVHLHPYCKIEHVGNNSVQVAYPVGRFKASFLGKGKLTVDKSLYCPDFGRRFDNDALAYCTSGSNIETSLQIQEL